MSDRKGARDLEPGDVCYLPVYGEVLNVTAMTDGGQRVKIKVAFNNSDGWVVDRERRPDFKFTDEAPTVELLCPPAATLYVTAEDDQM
jgi:hypothetical protein